MVADPVADTAEAQHLYDIEFVDLTVIKEMDAIVFAVAHREFTALTMENTASLYNDGIKVLIDVKSLFDRKEYTDAGWVYWRL